MKTTKKMKAMKAMSVSEMIKQLETIKNTHGDTQLKFIDEKGKQFYTDLNTQTINGITVMEIKQG